MGTLYSTLRWRAARSKALARDADRCSVSRLLGGECSASLHVHHIRPVSEGGDPFDLDNLATACESHHPAWEALRRNLLANLDRPREGDRRPQCHHRHPTQAGREACERRMVRDWERRQVAA